MLKTKKLMGFSFVHSTMDELVKEIDLRIKVEKRTFIVTANPEIVMHALSDQQYGNIVKQADYITPDGIGVIIGSKIVKRPLKERLPGFDLMGRLLDISNKKSYRVYLLGATEEVISAAKENMEKKYSNINIVGYHNGYFDWKDESLLQEMKEAHPDIVFVGLGFPRQEKWIIENMNKFDKGIFIGLGGSFDVWAGKVKRAPKIWQKLNLEWLYRLLKQPSRWRRMLVLPLFLLKVLKLRLSNKNGM